MGYRGDRVLYRRPKRQLLRRVALTVTAATAIQAMGVVVPAAAATHPTMTAPALQAPANGSSSVEMPLLEWTKAANVVRYAVEVYRTSSTGSIPSCAAETVSTRFVCSGLRPGNYRWTVHGIGVEGRRGPESAARTFTILPRPFAAPTLLAPANGTVFEYPGAMGTLRWSPVAGAEEYLVQFAEDATFTSVVGTVDATREGIVAPPHWLNTELYWRVRAQTADESSTGPWSAARRIRVEWDDRVSSLSPPDGATIGPGYLTWAPVLGAIAYDIEITRLGPPDVLWATAWRRAASFDISNFPDGSYRWRIRPFVGSLGAWTTPRVVTIDTDATPPPEPVDLVLPQLDVIGPADGATGVVQELDPMRWTPVAGALGYDVQIAENDGPLPNFGLEGPVGIPNPLDIRPLWAGVEYRWRVRANATDGIGNVGLWSEERTFTTAAAGAVALHAPSNGATLENEALLFSWTTPSNAPVAWLEIAPSPAFEWEETRTTEIRRASRVVLHDPLPRGTWYWRIRAGRDWVAATSPTRTLTIVDRTPPVGIVGVPEESTTASEITLEIRAEDGVSEVTHAAVSPDGMTWQTFPVQEPRTLSLISPPYPSTGWSMRTVWMRYRDAAGNWSAPASATFEYRPFDGVPPVMGPIRRAFVTGSSVTSTGTLPMQISWTSTDNASGVAAHLVSENKSGSTHWMMTGPIAGTSLSSTVAGGSTYTHRIWALDRQGNQSTPRVAPTLAVVRINEFDSRIRYQGRWSEVSGSAYLSGKTRTSAASGATATLVVRAGSIAWVARKGPNRGKAEVYVDGVRVTTVDLYASGYQDRRVVWSRSWSSIGEHEIRIRVLGTAGRPTVDVDAFFVLDHPTGQRIELGRGS